MTTHLIKPKLDRTYPEVAYGDGVYLYDTTGKNYLDASSGAMTSNIGHGVKEIGDALRSQAEKVAFIFRSQFTSGPAEALATKISSLLPHPLKNVFFVNSGSEASEYAIRAVQQYWRERGRPSKVKVLGRERSYHGMTMGSLSLSGHENRRVDYGSLLHPFAVAPAAYCYRCPFGLAPDSCALECASAWEAAILEAGPENVAAVIAEPIVGAAAGAVPAPAGYFQALRRICDKYDVLLIMDEVITGFGRTGEWFAFASEGIVPDVVLTGKGTSAGYAPMAAVILQTGIIEAMREGSGAAPFGHTFSGNPLSAAACLAVLNYVEAHDLLANARARGAQLRQGLEDLSQRFPFMVDVRGRGLLLGFEFVMDRATREPPPREKNISARFTDICHDGGLIVYPAGTGALNNATIISPPLVISADEVEDLLQRLSRALTRLEAEVRNWHPAA